MGQKTPKMYVMFGQIYNFKQYKYNEFVIVAIVVLAARHDHISTHEIYLIIAQHMDYSISKDIPVSAHRTPRKYIS